MKTINNTCKEVLPSLLDKSKTQTIRRAFLTKEEHLMRCPVCYTFEKKRREGNPITRHQELGTDGTVQCKQDSWFKPPKYKVGDKVQIVWNEESKEKSFPVDCGTHEDYYNKILGEAEITEVFEIEMSKEPNLMGGWKLQVTNNLYDSSEFFSSPFLSDKEVEDLAKRDGFKSAKEMFKWFDKQYDLSSPKKFYVYRWKWL